MLTLNVILLLVITIGLIQLDLIVSNALSSSPSSINQPHIQLLQQSDNQINLIDGLTSDWINSTIISNQVNYTSPWLIGDHLRCTIKLITDYDLLDNGYYNQSNPINQLIVWFQLEESPAIQLWMDSNERMDLFSREYLIDLPLIRNQVFRLLINFQSSRSFNYVPQLIKSLEIDRCWHTYQDCPILSCLTNGSSINQVSCTFNPNLSFNCSTQGVCIHRDEVCDFEVNCPDGSDEVNCDQPLIADPIGILNLSEGGDGDNTITTNRSESISGLIRCSFEVDYCSWKPIIIQSTNEFCLRKNCSSMSGGLIRTIAAHSLTTGPTFDHTLGTLRGHYLLLRSTSKLGKSIGSIVSLTQIGGHCKLIFYYLTNSHYGQVLIRSSESLTSRNPFSTIEVIDLDWGKSLYTRVEVEIDLGSESGEWLFLVAMVKGDENVYLTIDDIYFTKGCFPIDHSSTSSQPTTPTPTPTTTTSTSTLSPSTSNSTLKPAIN